MRRVPFVAGGLLAVGATVLGSTQMRGSAQSGTPEVEPRSLVGAWRVTFDTPAGESQSLLTVMADGTLIFSGRPVTPASGGFPVIFSSTAHGVWEPAGAKAVVMTWVGLVTDGEGTLLAVVTDSVEASLAAGAETWSGSYSATVNDPDGNPIYTGGATVRATRIKVQPVVAATEGTVSPE